MRRVRPISGFLPLGQWAKVIDRLTKKSEQVYPFLKGNDEIDFLKSQSEILGDRIRTSDIQDHSFCSQGHYFSLDMLIIYTDLLNNKNFLGSVISVP